MKDHLSALNVLRGSKRHLRSLAVGAAGLVSTAAVACGGGEEVQTGQTAAPPTVQELTKSIEKAFLASADGVPQELQRSLEMCTSDPAIDGSAVTEIVDNCRQTGQEICRFRRSKRHWPDDFREDVEQALNDQQQYTLWPTR